MQTSTAGNVESDELELEIENETETGTITFADLGLGEVTLRSLEKAGFTTPSPIQAGLIPAALEGRDCLGNAPTGTGKTAAFLLPIMEKLDERERRPQVLILAPTRELAHQIGTEFGRLSFGRRSFAVAVVGGESIIRQQRMLGAGCQVVIATPGRLMDLMSRNAIRLDKVKTVILDEADQMLDIGFRPAVEEILRAVPEGRQTLLLSATMPKEVSQLANTYLTDPVDVRLIKENEDATIPAIRQSYIMVAADRKFELLIGLIRREEPGRAIVFCRTKRGADRVGLAAPPGRLQGRHDARQPQPGPDGTGSCTASGSAGCRSWSPPTSSVAGSTSEASPTSSTSTCPKTPSTTSTGSVGPAGWEPMARRSRWSSPTRERCSTRSSGPSPVSWKPTWSTASLPRPARSSARNAPPPAVGVVPLAAVGRSTRPAAVATTMVRATAVARATAARSKVVATGARRAPVADQGWSAGHDHRSRRLAGYWVQTQCSAGLREVSFLQLP